MELKKHHKKVLEETFGINEIPLSKKEREELLLSLLDLFSERGLNEDLEPNQFGLCLDEIIGVISSNDHH